MMLRIVDVAQPELGRGGCCDALSSWRIVIMPRSVMAHARKVFWEVGGVVDGGSFTPSLGLSCSAGAAREI